MFHSDVRHQLAYAVGWYIAAHLLCLLAASVSVKKPPFAWAAFLRLWLGDEIRRACERRFARNQVLALIG